MLVEHWRRIENTQDRLDGYGRLTVVQFDDDAGETLLPEGHQHAASDDGHSIGGDAVGEDHVERHGQGNVAELRH